MAQQNLTIGAEGAGQGESLFSAFTKIESMMTELYTDDASDVNSVNGASGTVVLDTDDVAQGTTNLYNQNHTGDVTGSVALTIADNVALGGSPTTTTQSAGDNSTKVATTAYADTAVANAIDSAPAALDTLNELAASLNDDANFAGTMTTSLAGKLATTAGAVGTANLADDAVTNDKVADDAISFEKIDAEFSTASALSAAASVDVNFDAAQVFTLTPNQATTLNITNPKIGITKCAILTGAGGSYTLAFTVGGASGTFNKIAGDYDDTSSTKNFVQIVCVGATEFWYSISQIAS